MLPSPSSSSCSPQTPLPLSPLSFLSIVSFFCAFQESASGLVASTSSCPFGEGVEFTGSITCNCSKYFLWRHLKSPQLAHPCRPPLPFQSRRFTIVLEIKSSVMRRITRLMIPDSTAMPLTSFLLSSEALPKILSFMCPSAVVMLYECNDFVKG